LLKIRRLFLFYFLLLQNSVSGTKLYTVYLSLIILVISKQMITLQTYILISVNMYKLQMMNTLSFRKTAKYILFYINYLIESFNQNH